MSDVRVRDSQDYWVRRRGKSIAPFRLLESPLWVGRSVEAEEKLVDNIFVCAQLFNPTIPCRKIGCTADV